MKQRGGGARPASGGIARTSSKATKKSRSCENLLEQPPTSGLPQQSTCHQLLSDMEPKRAPLQSHPSSNSFDFSSRNDCQSFQSYLEKDSTQKGLAGHLYECPIELQTHQSLIESERESVISLMHANFRAKRKLVICGLPHDCFEENIRHFLMDFEFRIVSKIKDSSVRVLFSEPLQAKEALVFLNTTPFHHHKLSASFGHPDSLLFVGNLPYTYTTSDLFQLFKNFGEMVRCLVVVSLATGLSKGYGFVEFATREEALMAKQQMATKVVGLRSLRVDFSDNGMQTCEDLQSQTVFVDRLPKGFKDDIALRELFSQYGRVNFCQVAVTAASGVSRGFAFIDMSTAEAAEGAQLGCNGASYLGQEIRVSFGMPCRPGACILQHKNNLHFNSSSIHVKMGGGALSSSYKENMPFIPSHMVQSSKSKGRPQSHNLLKSVSDPNMTFLPLPHPLITETTGPELNSLRPPVSPSPSELSSDSLTQLTLATAGSVFPGLHQPIAKSVSAPTVLSGSCEENAVWGLGSRNTEESAPHLLRKRPASESDLFASLYHESTAYDKPYIGQHQQGIPFTHPLKRIRMD